MCPEPGAVVDPATGHCYFVLPGPERGWMSASDACAALAPPAHLATVTSQGEQDALATLSLQQSAWIGLSGAPGALAWVTGEPLGFTAWAPSQPNSSGPACVRVESGSKLWGDDSCNKPRDSICERE